jgi:hypothetical protein
MEKKWNNLQENKIKRKMETAKENTWRLDEIG